MKYRNKYMEVEAVQWTGNNYEEIEKFCGKNRVELVNSKVSYDRHLMFKDDGYSYLIPAHESEYIIKDKDNRFFIYDKEYFENNWLNEDEWENLDDGYHTFKELYKYRKLYNAAFFNLLPKDIVLKSKKHSDGEECFGGGWFIVQAELPTGQISNHYEMKDWELFKIPEKERANEWDGHTPEDVANRIEKYILNN